MKQITPLLVSLVLSGLLLPVPARAQTWIQATADARLMKAHIDNNNGGLGSMALKVGNGESRAIVRFALPPEGIRPDDVAHIRLQRDRWTRGANRGTWVIANLVSTCDGAPEWAEGTDRFDRFYCLGNCFREPDDASCPTDGSPGVTWRCAEDSDTSNGNPDCPEEWNGGQEFVRRSPDVPPKINELFPDVPLDPDAPAALVNREDDASPVLFDVTAHVRRAYACGDLSPSWLLRRASRSGKKVRLLTREAREAACECDRPHLCQLDALEPVLYLGPPEGLQ